LQSLTCLYPNHDLLNSPLYSICYITPNTIYVSLYHALYNNFWYNRIFQMRFTEPSNIVYTISSDTAKISSAILISWYKLILWCIVYTISPETIVISNTIIFLNAIYEIFYYMVYYSFWYDLLKFPSRNSFDLYVFRVFPLAKTCQEKMFLLDHPRGSLFKNDLSDEFPR
jgi:hypothetical protein